MNAVISDLDKANHFNKFFQEVFSLDDGKNLDLNDKTTSYMEAFEISFLDILQSVHMIKDKITRTPDNVPAYFIKRTISSILVPLHFLFNSTLFLNAIPVQWKRALIVPVFKKGNRSKADNYRPISLTSSICRIYESILCKKILFYLQANNLISPNQFGFLPNKSTCSQLLTCLHQWLISFSSNQNLNVIHRLFQSF